MDTRQLWTKMAQFKAVVLSLQYMQIIIQTGPVTGNQIARKSGGRLIQ